MLLGLMSGSRFFATESALVDILWLELWVPTPYDLRSLSMRYQTPPCKSFLSSSTPHVWSITKICAKAFTCVELAFAKNSEPEAWLQSWLPAFHDLVEFCRRTKPISKQAWAWIQAWFARTLQRRDCRKSVWLTAHGIRQRTKSTTSRTLCYSSSLPFFNRYRPRKVKPFSSMCGLPFSYWNEQTPIHVSHGPAARLCSVDLGISSLKTVSIYLYVWIEGFMIGMQPGTWGLKPK